MEFSWCNIIYVDRAVTRDRYLRREQHMCGQDRTEWESAQIADNVSQLLDLFGGGTATH